MVKNKDRKKKGTASVQKTATKSKNKLEKELKKQIEQLGEVRFMTIFVICLFSFFFLPLSIMYLGKY